MQKIKTGYAYLFFFLYNSINNKNNILVQWKSVFVILALELFLLLSIVLYIENLTRISIIPENFNRLYLLVFILPLVGLKLWFFERNENWKKYLEEFHSWPLVRQKKWNWIMRCMVFFVFANLIFAFYWMSQIDWSQYN